MSTCSGSSNCLLVLPYSPCHILEPKTSHHPKQVFPEPWTMIGKGEGGQPRRLARASNWERSIGAFLASDALFAATPEPGAPINSGVWLAKPREWLFRAAVRCLYNCSWEAERGFNSISRPRRVANNAPLIRRLAAGVGDGSVISALGNHSTPSIKDAFKLAMRLMRGTTFYRENTWRFVSGNLDQGLLFYLMYLRYGVGTWSSPFPREPESVYVNHYWGPGKPWDQPGRKAQQVRCQHARLDACAPQRPRLSIDRRSIQHSTQ